MSDIFAAPDAYAAEKMTAPSADSGANGRIKYEIQNQSGDKATIGDQDLIQQLQAAGHNPTGLSPDAKLVSFQDAHGQYQVPVEQVLGKLGWQVTNKNFADSDRSNVNPALTFAVNTPSMANDQTKKEFLTQYLQHHGIDHPQVDGMGDDWHAFDPTTGRWMALTKGGGLGVDDLAKYGAKAPSFLGAVLGAGFGTAGSPVGMAAGAAGGGFAGARLADAGGAMVDPQAYESALGKQGWQQTASNWSKDVAMDALGGAAGGAIGKMLPGVAQTGIASKAADLGGQLASKVGPGIESLGNMASSGIASDIGPTMIDPLGNALAGDILQTPSWAIKQGANAWQHGAPQIGKGMAAVGESPFMNAVAPEFSANLRQGARGMKLKYPEFTKFSPAEEAMTEAPWAHTPQHGPININSPQTFNTAEEALRHTPFGGVGKVADAAHGAGSLLMAPNKAAWNLGAQGLQRGGQLAQGLGSMAQTVGKAAGPHELNAATHYGSEELRNRLLKRQRDLQMQGVDRKLVPDQLVQNDLPQY